MFSFFVIIHVLPLQDQWKPRILEGKKRLKCITTIITTVFPMHQQMWYIIQLSAYYHFFANNKFIKNTQKYFHSKELVNIWNQQVSGLLVISIDTHKLVREIKHWKETERHSSHWPSFPGFCLSESSFINTKSICHSTERNLTKNVMVGWWRMVRLATRWTEMASLSQYCAFIRLGILYWPLSRSGNLQHYRLTMPQPGPIISMLASQYFLFQLLLYDSKSSNMKWDLF